MNDDTILHDPSVSNLPLFFIPTPRCKKMFCLNSLWGGQPWKWGLEPTLGGQGLRETHRYRKLPVAFPGHTQRHLLAPVPPRGGNELRAAGSLEEAQCRPGPLPSTCLGQLHVYGVWFTAISQTHHSSQRPDRLSRASDARSWAQ